MPSMVLIFPQQTFYTIPQVVAEYTFEIQLVHYQNPNHLLIDNENCCEYRSDLSLCVCDNAFVFCVRERGSNSCDMEEIRTRKIATDDDDLSFSVGDRIGSEHRNPLTVTGDVWPVSTANDGGSLITWCNDRDCHSEYC